jgi:hypothetical protein
MFGPEAPYEREGTSTMLYFPADKPSERMKTQFIFITEQATHAYH